MAEEKKSFSDNYVLLITAYSMSVSILYLVGYWSSFGINIFEYTALTDLIKFAIYPLLIGVFFSLSPTLIGVSLAVKSRKSAERVGKEVTVSKKTLRFIVYPVSALLLIHSIFFDKGAAKWIYISLTLGTILWFETEDSNLLRDMLPDAAVHRIVFFIIIQIVVGAFFIGKFNAANVISGAKAKTVSSKVFKEKGTDSFDKKGLLEGQENLKYLGTVGEYVFFLSSDNNIKYIVKSSDLHFLELK